MGSAPSKQVKFVRQQRVNKFEKHIESLNSANESFCVAHGYWQPNRKECINIFKELAIKEEGHQHNHVSYLGKALTDIPTKVVEKGVECVERIPYFGAPLGKGVYMSGSIISIAGGLVSAAGDILNPGTSEDSGKHLQSSIDHDQDYTEKLSNSMTKFKQTMEQNIDFVNKSKFTDKELHAIAKQIIELSEEKTLCRPVVVIISEILNTVTKPKVQKALMELRSQLSTIGIEINPRSGPVKRETTGPIIKVKTNGILNLPQQAFNPPDQLSGEGGKAGKIDIWSEIKDDTSTIRQEFKEIATSLEVKEKIINGAVDEWREAYGKQ